MLINNFATLSIDSRLADALSPILDKSIRHRLHAVEVQTKILLNDMEVVLYRIARQEAGVYLGDIRVGGWHRAATELSILQWFKKLLAANPDASPRDLESALTLELELRTESMQQTSASMVSELARTMNDVNSDMKGDWEDIRVGGWYRASTECRVLTWLLRIVEELADGKEASSPPWFSEEEEEAD